MVEIETDRLRLRAPEPGDGGRIASLVGDWEVARGLSRVPHPYTLDDADAFIADVRDWPDGVRPFAVERRGEGLVGMLGFTYTPGEPWAELGYWFGRPHWNRGYASEAVTAAMGWAGSRWGRRAIAAGHFADNPASGRVLEKAGFLYTGVTQPRLSLARGEAAPTRMMVWLA